MTGLIAGKRWSRAAILLAVTLGVVIFANLLSRQLMGVYIHDQAEQIVYSQDWRLVYDEQMPVYQWIANTFLRLTDYWVLTLDLIKYAWVLLAVIALYRLGDRMSASATGGALAVLLAFLLPTMNEDMLREYSHSAALLAFTCASALFFVPEGRARASFPRWRPALAFIWAAGIMAKHSAMIFMAAEIMAFIWIYRPARQEIRSLIMTAGMSLIIVLPIYLIILFRGAVVAEGVEEFMGEGSPFARFRGLADFAGSVPAEGALLFLALIVAYGFARGKAGTPIDANMRFLFAFNAVVLALFLLGVLISNASVFRDRWIAPSLILLAPVAARWFILGLKARTAHLLAVGLSVLLVAIGIERAAEPYLDGRAGKIGTANLPLKSIAREVQDMTEPGDSVVAVNQAVAGTIKGRAPELVIYSPWTIENLPQAIDEVLLVTTQKPSIKPLNFPDDSWVCEAPSEYDMPYHLVAAGTFHVEISRCRRG